MTCHETQKSLSDYLDGRLAAEAEAELEAHLATCVACRAALAELRRVDELLHAFADPPVDEARLDGLWQRVDQALDDVPEAASASAAEPAYLSDAPVLLPQPASMPRWLVSTLVAGGVAVVAVAVLAVTLVIHRGRSERESRRLAESSSAMGRTGWPSRPTSGDMAGPDHKADRAMAAGDQRVPPRAGDMKAGDMKAGDDMKAADDMKAGDSKSGSGLSTSGRRRRRHYSGGGSRRHSSGGSRASMRPRPRPMSSGGGGGGGSSLQDLLRSAGGMKSSGGGGSAASNLPKRLSGADIRQGIGRILGSARACYHRYRVAGTCRVRVVIRGSSGRPSSVRVLGTFAGTSTGRCVERAFRRARFKRFGSGSQSFVFPLVFR